MEDVRIDDNKRIYMTKTKIYCINCKHCVAKALPSGLNVTCIAPSNMREKESFYSVELYPILNPDVLNVKNECPYYERRTNELMQRENILAFRKRLDEIKKD
jgi:hypothetical protein